MPGNKLVRIIANSSVNGFFKANESVARLNSFSIFSDTIVFDEYKGENIDEGKRSLAVGLVLQQKNATFEDKDVDKLMSKVVSSMSEKLSIEIRGN